jgi:hypothetical protein
MEIPNGFFYLVFALCVIYLIMDSKKKNKPPKIRLGDFMMENIPSTQADKLALIQWLMDVKWKKKGKLQKVILKGSVGACIHISRFIKHISGDIRVSAYRGVKNEMFHLTRGWEHFQGTIYVTCIDEQVKLNIVEALLLIRNEHPGSDIVWPVKIEATEEITRIIHEGDK